jgi:hypothetical protein
VRAEIALLEDVHLDPPMGRKTDGDPVVGPAIAEQDDVGHRVFGQELGQKPAPAG